MTRRSFYFFFILLALPAFACQLTGGDADPTNSPPTQAPEDPPTQSPAEPTNEPAPTDIPPTDPPPTEEPTPTAIPDPTADFIEYVDPISGMSFSYPADWFLDSDGEIVAVVSNEELLEPDQFTDGAGIIFFSDPDVGILSPDAFLELFIADESIATDVETIEEPTPLIINGQNASRARYSGDIEGIALEFTLTAITNGGVGAIAFGITEPGETENYVVTLDQIVSTFVLGEAPKAIDGGHIAAGSDVAGLIAPGETVSWQFTANAGDSFSVFAVPDDELDVILDVQDATGSSILAEGPIDDSFGEEEITNLTISSDGDYQIVLSGFGGTSGGYTLYLDDAAGGVIDDGAELTFNSTLAGNIGANGAAAYTFQGEAGSPVTILVAPDSEADVVVHVLDAEGVTLQETDDSFDDENVLFTPESSGTYFVQVTEFYGEEASFDITLLSGSPDNGGGGEGGIAEINAPAALTVIREFNSISGNDSVDYVMPASQYRPFSVQVVSVGEFDALVEVVDPNGTLVVEQDNSFIDEQLVVIPDQNGDYIVTVSGFDSSIGDYEIAISNGGPGGVGYEGSVVMASDELENAEDVHNFPLFSLGANPVAVIVIPESGLDVIVEIGDDETSEIFATYDDTYGYEKFVYELPGEGDYFINVQGFEGATGEYDIILMGGSEIAFELAFGDVVYGTFDDEGLLGYTYRVIEDETLTVVVTPDENADVLIDIEPADSDEPYVSADDFLEGGAETAAHTFSAEERIFIFISGFEGALGSFRMDIE